MRAGWTSLLVIPDLLQFLLTTLFLFQKAGRVCTTRNCLSILVRNNLTSENIVILSNEQWTYLSSVYGGGPHIQWDNILRRWIVYREESDTNPEEREDEDIAEAQL